MCEWVSDVYIYIQEVSKTSGNRCYTAHYISIFVVANHSVQFLSKYRFGKDRGDTDQSKKGRITKGPAYLRKRVGRRGHLDD